ncbi:hypothetical protein MMC16_007808 [Acarospora aff. strigata]|nr:hypothetical protein [Acarospora aff. strigata]
MEGSSPEDISNAARGHKANLSNPNTSEESKAHSKEVLESLGDNPHYGQNQAESGDKNPNRVAGGLKATITNQSIGKEGTQQAQEKLENM